MFVSRVQCILVYALEIALCPLQMRACCVRVCLKIQKSHPVDVALAIARCTVYTFTNDMSQNPKCGHSERLFRTDERRKTEIKINTAARAKSTATWPTNGQWATEAKCQSVRMEWRNEKQKKMAAENTAHRLCLLGERASNSVATRGHNQTMVEIVCSDTGWHRAHKRKRADGDDIQASTGRNSYVKTAVNRILVFFSMVRVVGDAVAARSLLLWSLNNINCLNALWMDGERVSEGLWTRAEDECYFTVIMLFVKRKIRFVKTFFFFSFTETQRKVRLSAIALATVRLGRLFGCILSTRHFPSRSLCIFFLSFGAIHSFDGGRECFYQRQRVHDAHGHGAALHRENVLRNLFRARSWPVLLFFSGAGGRAISVFCIVIVTIFHVFEFEFPLQSSSWMRMIFGSFFPSETRRLYRRWPPRTPA